MSSGTLFFLLLILACPLMMIWMMRGGHGAHGASGHGTQDADGRAGHGGHNHMAPTEDEASLDELRRQHDELGHLIEEREATADRELVERR